jgi:hypothetical protein
MCEKPRTDGELEMPFGDAAHSGAVAAFEAVALRSWGAERYEAECCGAEVSGASDIGADLC